MMYQKKRTRFHGKDVRRRFSTKSEIFCPPPTTHHPPSSTPGFQVMVTSLMEMDSFPFVDRDSMENAYTEPTSYTSVTVATQSPTMPTTLQPSAVPSGPKSPTVVVAGVVAGVVVCVCVCVWALDVSMCPRGARRR